MKIFTPGRILLVGDHSDWTGKFNIKPANAIIVGLDKGIYAEVEKSNDIKFKFGDKVFKSSLNKDKLKETAKSGDFFSYAAGMFYYLSDFGGISITITNMDLPMRKGLASSAAICVLIAKAYNELYGLNLSNKKIMEYAYKGETLTPSKCGKGDQACVFGSKPVFITFDNDNVDIKEIKVKGEFYFLIVNLNSDKDTTKICNDIQSVFKTDKKVQNFILKDNKFICNVSKYALETGNNKLLGTMMKRSFRLFNKKVSHCSIEQLYSPVLKEVASNKIVKKLSYGVKGIGAQGDGSAQILCKDKNSQKILKKYLLSIYNMETEEFTLKQ